MLKIVIAQIGVSLLAVAAVAWFDWVAAYSIALGGLVALVPGVFLSWRMGFDVSPDQALRSLVMGQVGKIGITVVMFAAVFVWVRPLNVLMFFVALALIMLMNIIVPLVQKHSG
jgi:ATP synthase protein I